MHVVIRVIRRLGEFESLPPFTVDDLIVFVLAGFEIKKIGVDRDQHLFTGRDGPSHHLRRFLAAAQGITPVRFAKCHSSPR